MPDPEHDHITEADYVDPDQFPDYDQIESADAEADL